MRLTWKILLTFTLLCLPRVAAAQSPIIIGPNSTLVWDIAGPDLPTVSSFTYAVAVDGATPKTLTPVTCASSGAVGTWACSTPIAQIPTGSHSLTVTAASGSIVSLPSAPFAYVDMLIPIPQNLRAQP